MKTGYTCHPVKDIVIRIAKSIPMREACKAIRMREACKAILSATAMVGAILALISVVTPVTAQDAPLARIILPVRGQTLRGNVSIQGSATAPQFTRYQVMYAPEPDIANWVLINGAAQPVPNGSLAVWNTRPLADGKYAVKLQVFSADGSAVEALVRDITLANQSATPASGTPAALGVTTTLTSSAPISLTFSSNANTPTLNLADIPRAFAKGATYTAYAFGALLAYLILKRLLGFLLRKLFRRPVDFGR